jgi:hypothetical protein
MLIVKRGGDYARLHIQHSSILLLVSPLSLSITLEKFILSHPGQLGHFVIPRKEAGYADVDADAQSAAGVSPVDATGWRNGGIVGAQRDPDVPFPRHYIVRRIEANPSQFGQKSLDPRVRPIFRRSISAGPVTMKQIAAHIPAGDSQVSHERNEDVSEILTDTPS